MKLKLPDVTLVMVETREHALAALAVEDCLRAAEFGEVLILTDKPEMFNIEARHHTIVRAEDWPTKLGWCQAWWFDVVPHLRTSHSLNIQWDSWIWSPDLWRDEFLRYDFIGAPWVHLPPSGPRVGNGGFCLVSTRLKRYIADRRDRFPCDSDVDDALLCIKYRPALEAAGFLWAPERIAYYFSFEGCDGSEPKRHFGFHAAFNFPHVLSRERLVDRVRLILESPGLRENYMVKNLCQKHPDLMKNILGQICWEEEQGTKQESPDLSDTTLENRAALGI